MARKDLEGYVLYNPNTKELFYMNDSGYEVFLECKNNGTKYEIIENLNEKYENINKEKIKEDVEKFLYLLEKNKIIEHEG